MVAIILSAVVAVNTVVVTAIVDQDKKRVTFIGSQPGLKRPGTFLVEAGDTLKWQVQGPKGTPLPDLGEFRLHVVFSGFPRAIGKHQPLLLTGGKASDTLEAKDGAIVGTVNEASAGGDYSYQFELVSPKKTIRLACFWASGSDDPPIPIEMSTGTRGGGPGTPD